VERLFDMGSIALIFSIALLQVPADVVQTATDHLISHSGLLSHAPGWLAPFLARYVGLVATLLGALFLVAVRLSGNTVAAFFERTFSLVSKKLGLAIGSKIRSFQRGLDTMRSFSDFAVMSGLSLGMWALITTAYVQIIRAFVATPELRNISFSTSVLLMVVSGGASVFQLPVIGWFTQIGIVAFAIAGIAHVALEPATACAGAILLITFLSIVPVGLVWARFEHVSLRKIAEESGHTEQGLRSGAVPDSL